MASFWRTSSERARPIRKTALRLDPQWIEGKSRLAWIFATHPDRNIRAGAEAVRLAERACGLTGATNYPVLETLAAAYAETGRFEEAVAMQQKVYDWAGAQGQTIQAEPAKQRLARYRSGEPCREP
jgi:hypothetical protein